MILSGHLILSARGTINPREPLQLHKTHADAVRVAKRTLPKGTYTIKLAKPFFNTAYGSAMLALIRKRMEAGTDPKSKLENGTGPAHVNGNRNGMCAIPASILPSGQTALQQTLARLKLAKMLNGVAEKARTDAIPILPSGSRAMPETIARVNGERAHLSSTTLLPSDKPKKEKPTWDLNRLYNVYNRQSLCTQSSIDREAKCKHAIKLCQERLSIFAKRDTVATPLDMALRKVDLLILFRAGRLPKALQQIAKLSKLTLTT